MSQGIDIKNAQGNHFTIDYPDNSEDVLLTTKNLSSTLLINSIAELKLIDGTVSDKLEILGYYFAGDGGGGTFYWDSASTEIDNGGTIIQATGVTTGRWKRVGYNVIPYNDVKFFGAKGDDSADDTVSFINAIANNNIISVNNGVFIVSSLDITKDIKIIGNGTIKQKAGTGNVSLIQCLLDKEIIIDGVNLTGNYLNQPTQTALGLNFIWVSIGSLKMYNCLVTNTKGHAIRTGNIDDFNASKFAHDCVFENNRIIQPLNSSGNTISGDCLRIERTKGAIFRNNFVYGGYSGIRTQLYCKNLEFYNNDVSYAYPDVGITVALSENIIAKNNYCHHNESHGFEVDGVVNCSISGNISKYNKKSGFFGGELGAKAYANSSMYWGSISDTDYNGYNYSNQVYSSTYVPCYNTEYTHNISQDNLRCDQFNGVDGDLYAYNFVDNKATKETNYKYQLIVDGATTNKTKIKIYNNTFVNSTEDLHTIHFSNYNYDADVEDNVYNGALKPISNFGVKGSYDYNFVNRYLLDSTKRSVLLADKYDSLSPTKFAVSSTPTGDTTYPFSVTGSGAGEKILKIVARAESGTVGCYVALNLYNSSGGYVKTLLEETYTVLTNEYKEFVYRIPADTISTSGNTLKPQIRFPYASVAIYIQELNIYTVMGV